MQIDHCPVCLKSSIKPVLKAKDYTVSGELFEIWECSDCQLRFTQSIPDQESMGAYYQSENYISHSNTSKGWINRLYHIVRKRTLVKKERILVRHTGRKNGNLLDLGAGSGAFLGFMQSRGWKATGIEPDAAAREIALRDHGVKLLPVERFKELPSASFDAITLWHVMEHVHALHDYVDQLKRLLAPGGVIFIAVPNYTSWDCSVYQEFWAAYDVPRHLYHFSPNAVKTLLDGHALTVSHIQPMWFDSFYISLLSEKYKRGGNHPVRGFFTGTVSNMMTLFNWEKCSSLIYIAREPG